MKKILLILFISVGCSEDEPTPVKLVATDLYSQHIQTFYAEADLRGLDLPNITPEVRFTSNPEFKKDCISDGGGYITSISYQEGNKYIIEITDLYSVYENGNEFELPIIRELGHLLLDKPYEADPWILLPGETSAVNPLCSCASKAIDWNNKRTEVFDYLFTQ